MRRILISVAAGLLVCSAAWPGEEDNLPDIGSPADTTITQSDEYQIGRMVVKGLRDAGKILEDPEATEYIQSIGTRLASHAQDGKQRFTFFIVKDPSINAFALPGGFIGVNEGLILATADESELAGVLAHEIAHVTQRHLARGIQAEGRSSLVSAAAMLAAILIGATTGVSSDIMMGSIAVAQGAAAQQRLNFTRANEYEADRIGIGTMAASGFDPQSMPAFFETLERRTGLQGSQVPELLQSHPVTSARIAESRNRARQYDIPLPPDSVSYGLTRERLRLLSLGSDTDARAYYKQYLATEKVRTDAQRYGQALSLMQSGAPEEAIPILQGLSEKNPDIMQYRSALGEAQMATGEKQESLSTFARALTLFPRNVPLTVRYAEALMRAGQPKKAHEILLDLFNTVYPTPEQCRLIALAANSAGDVGDAYYYMSEYHVMSGELMLALNQLQLALGSPNLSEVQRARFQARIEELREYLPKGKARMAAGTEDPNSRPDPPSRTDPQPHPRLVR
ncbi:MAG TPA: M48 family metalloprotease [Steroidobacteraceae bacterium]|jgi:predicted Zn-dependent protease|nr:M48 family metalloprotease [Steroidobacteraceae bacterium]